MNKIEKVEVEMEIRSIQDKVNAGTLKVEDAKKELDALKVRKVEFDKQEALVVAPLTTRATSYADIKNALLEKRAITLTGNGAISQVTEIVQEVKGIVPLLNEVRYFYGANAQTNIPLLTPGLATPAQVVEGFTTGSEDSTAALSLKSVTPVGWTSTLPVSYDALNLNSANLESALPAAFADVYAQTMHALVIAKMFASAGVAAANKTAGTGAGSTGAAYPTLHDLIDLSYVLLDKNMLSPKMVMNSKMIVEALKTATDTAGKIVAEEYYRNKSINGIPVILTGGAPVATTKDVIQVWGGSLMNIGIGVASDLMIEPKKKVGDGNTYFDALMYFMAEVIQPKNAFAIIAK